MQASPFEIRNKTKTMQGVGANFNKPTRGDKKYFTLENNPAISPKTKANIIQGKFYQFQEKVMDHLLKLQ